MEDGRKFQVIRHLKVDPKKGPEKSVAVFKVYFKFSGLPLRVNKRLSLIPAPFSDDQTRIPSENLDCNRGWLFSGNISVGNQGLC